MPFDQQCSFSCFQKGPCVLEGLIVGRGPIRVQPKFNHMRAGLFVYSLILAWLVTVGSNRCEVGCHFKVRERLEGCNNSEIFLEE